MSKISDTEGGGGDSVATTISCVLVVVTTEPSNKDTFGDFGGNTKSTTVPASACIGEPR
jgi:hypothetical protein